MAIGLNCKKKEAHLHIHREDRFFCVDLEINRDLSMIHSSRQFTC